MTEKEIQERAFALYTKLLEKGHLNRNHEMVVPYNQEERVRLCIFRLAAAQGTEVFESGENLHLITLPEGSIFATSYSQAVTQSRQALDVVDWYIISFIQLVFCWEIDNDYSHKMNIEREGVTYPQLEEMISKLFSDWKAINEDTDEQFSDQFKLAVDKVYHKWDNLQYQKPRIKYSLSSRLGLIHKAMTIFKDGKLVHISDAHKTASIVYPNDILYERLEYVFSNLDRYQILKSLVNDSLEMYRNKTDVQIRNLIREQENGGTA